MGFLGHTWVPWIVVNPDVAAELKDISATLESIEAVTDLTALRAEIAELSELSLIHI